MRRAVGNYELDDDPARIDPAAAAAFLTAEAYWGRWRTEQDVGRQIAAAWRVAGAYDAAGAMVGFARAISDGGSAYLADVYVLPAHRGRGLGKAIVAMMVEEGPGAGFRWMLHTSDAYGLYRQFGFAPPPDTYMERSGGYGGAGSPPMSGGIPGGRPPGSTQPLTGEHVRLEPLGPHHVPGLLRAAAQDPSLYQWVLVPQDEPAMRRHVEDALAARAKGIAVPFAVVRLADETVIGSTRFHQLDDVRNQRSQNAIRRIGGTFEGVLRSHRLAVDQSPRDSARFSITAAEWPAVRQHLADLAARYPEGAARRQAAGQHPH